MEFLDKKPMNKEKTMRKTCWTLASMLFFALTATFAPAETISLDTLLSEMVDRSTLAEFPEPSYFCRQASSYDRGAKSPEENWFANNDRSFFVRKETNQGREEWVMMDVEGPGAIVRWWVTAPKYVGTIRIYLDGAEEPVIAAKVDELIGGDALVGAPLSEENARGRNLYLPIPYAKHCKVTFDRPNFQDTKKPEDLLYYQINYRTYENGTQVEPFTHQTLEKLRGKIEKTQKLLSGEVNVLQPKVIGPAGSFHSRLSYPTGRQVAPQIKLRGRAAVSHLELKLQADDMTQATRSTILKIDFDGKNTVWCPVGDFFGSGVGINPFKDWYRTVEENGKMHSRWVMPFRESCDIAVINLDKQQDVEVDLRVQSLPWQWDDRSMYFHAGWRQDRRIESAGGTGAMDWNYITLEGKGTFVGDTLSVLNRTKAWWGEGDEKIYIDGEAFPSHFGTGTEDYYGYAWCTPEFFESPFHAQPRAEGPGNYGHTTNSRVRLLDDIPFTESLRVDMEVWHWATVEIDYAVATYWYARPGTTPNLPPLKENIEEATAEVVYDTPFEINIPGFKIEKEPAGSLSVQKMTQSFGEGWNQGDQLWWREGKPGNVLEIVKEVEKAGPKRLIVELTKARDYAIVQFLLDGEPIGKPIDLYNPEVIPTGEIDLGTFDLSAGEHTVGVKILGKNQKADPSFMVGIDRIRLVPEK